jgi:diguanylate cyclase (GGDEF)-like protein/putative nucleotidyltransferase with HDIG domain
MKAVGHETDTPLDEAALRAAHETLTRILGAIEEYVYTGELLAGGAYELVFAGPCREQFLGLTVEEAREAVWRHYVHPDDIELFDTAHEGSLVSGRLDVEYRLIGADGVLRWVRDRGRVREEHGRRFLDGSILDVTAVHLAQEQLKAARAEADRLAHVDHLTGTANRRSLSRVLADAGDELLGLLSIDLDRFKQVNDLYGHAAGDAVLVAVAGRLRAGVRHSDAVLRMGGEEFLVVLRGATDENQVLAAAEHLRRSVEAEPVVTGSERLAVTVSVGVALAPAGTPDVEAVLSRADEALYAAKRRGRNRVELASAEPAGAGRQHATGDDTEALRVARALAITLGSFAPGWLEHLEAVSELSADVARQLGRTAGEVLRCRIAGLVHDVGKARVPQAIRDKPGPLEDAEWDAMRAHAELGAAMLEAVPELRLLSGIVRHHREWVDGGGYPAGLAGEAIPIEARIIGAADAWFALRTPRPYRPALSRADALAELHRAAGQRYDADVVAALDAVVARHGVPNLRLAA